MKHIGVLPTRIRTRFLATVACLGAFALISPAPVFAAPSEPGSSDWYVSNDGSDTEDCTDPGRSCESIGYAISQAGAGDTIHVAAGTYNEKLMVNKPVSLKGAGPGESIVSGVNVEPGSGSGSGLVAVESSDWTSGAQASIEGFTFRDATSVTHNSAGTPILMLIKGAGMGAGHDVIVKGNRFELGETDANTDTHGSHGLVVGSGAATTLVDNSFTGFWQGILLEGADSSDIRGNTFSNLQPVTQAGYNPIGLYILSDKANVMSGFTVNGNAFNGFNGYGIALSAAYAKGGCTQTPCDGDLEQVDIFDNQFAMTGAPVQGEGAAITMRTTKAGASLEATVRNNTGFIDRPSVPIATDVAEDSHFNVTEDDNSIVDGRPTTVELKAAAEFDKGSAEDLHVTVHSIASGEINGTVRVLNGDTEVASGDLAAGAFVASLSSLPTGAAALRAEFTSAEDSPFNDSVSEPLTVTVTKPQPQQPTAPPAESTESLSQLLEDLGIDPSTAAEEFELDNTDDGALDGWDPKAPLNGSFPWTGTDDEYVDLYAYSVPTFIGTFPVVDGKVIIAGADLSALPSGLHTLVMVGQSTRQLQALAINLIEQISPPPDTETPDTEAPGDPDPGDEGPDQEAEDPAPIGKQNEATDRLPDTGVDQAPVIVTGLALLLLGSTAILASRRTRRN